MHGLSRGRNQSSSPSSASVPVRNDVQFPTQEGTGLTGYSVLNMDTVRPIHRIITWECANDNFTRWTGLIVPYHFTVSVEIIDGDHKLVNMKYFFTRKLMFVKECDAVVCYPGGFGTMDEAMEVLTLVQTGKRDVVPMILADAAGGT